jgi:sporulation integral membrane protein YlbJ
MKHLGRIGAFLAIFALFGGLLVWPQAAAQGAREGLKLCAEVAIPALFPFLVLSSMAVSLGAAAVLGKLLLPVTGPLFRLGGASSALALGLLGGYPAGAQAVRSLYEQGQCSRTQAERALAFCNNCGPAFLLGVAGSGVFHSGAVGGLLLAGHWLGAFTVGLLFRFYGKEEENHGNSMPIVAVSAPKALTEAVRTGLMAMGNVCAYTVLFRVVVRLLEQTGILAPVASLPNGAAVFTGLLDLTGGVSALTPAAPFAPELAAALMGFGGVSVLCQTLAVLEDSGLSLWPGVAGKLLHGCFAALWTHLLLTAVPLSEQSMAAAGRGSGGAVFVPVWAGGAILAMHCLIWAVFMVFHSGKKGRRRV